VPKTAAIVQNTNQESGPNPQVGRRPSPDTAKAILYATREVLAEAGVHGLTVEAVAARSGVAKTTIYRRWRSRDELALAVLIEMVHDQVRSVPDRGNTKDQLVAFVGGAIRILNSTLMGRVMQGLVSELATNQQLALGFREEVVARRVAELTRLLELGIERGEIRPDANIKMANELLFGPIYYRLLLSGEPLNTKLAERLVDSYLCSVGLPPSPGRRGAKGDLNSGARA
jgi:AcrR family transcriptional regulator